MITMGNVPDSRSAEQIEGHPPRAAEEDLWSESKLCYLPLSALPTPHSCLQHGRATS